MRCLISVFNGTIQYYYVRYWSNLYIQRCHIRYLVAKKWQRLLLWGQEEWKVRERRRRRGCWSAAFADLYVVLTRVSAHNQVHTLRLSHMPASQLNDLYSHFQELVLVPCQIPVRVQCLELVLVPGPMVLQWKLWKPWATTVMISFISYTTSFRFCTALEFFYVSHFLFSLSARVILVFSFLFYVRFLWVDLLLMHNFKSCFI